MPAWDARKVKEHAHTVPPYTQINVRKVLTEGRSLSSARTTDVTHSQPSYHLMIYFLLRPVHKNN